MAKITRVGACLVVPIPLDVLQSLGLKEGDEVRIQRHGEVLEITAPPKPSKQ